MGADASAIDDILRALFAGAKGKVVNVDLFVKRASRMRSPLQLDLLNAADTGGVTGADAANYQRLM